MPDALSKTIPIWIAVLNRLLFPGRPETHHLRTPEAVISQSEHAQIEELLESFTADIGTLGLDVDSLRSRLGAKAMEPIWVTPEEVLPIVPPKSSGSNVVVLCTASGRTASFERPTSEYVQGAADDSESWAHGLDAASFWEHEQQLLSMSEDDLPVAIGTLMAQSRSREVSRQATLIKPTNGIWISNNTAAEARYADYDLVVFCSQHPSELLAAKLKGRYVHLSCGTGKVGSRQLRAELHKLVYLTKILTPTSRVLVTCPTGTDIAVGVALAVICLFYGHDGTMVPSGVVVKRSKPLIKQRLSWIMIAMPDAAPSRATLQSVNAFLLG